MFTEAATRVIGKIPGIRSGLTAVLTRLGKTESVTPIDVTISRQVKYVRGSTVSGVSHTAGVSMITRQKERGWNIRIIRPEPRLFLTFDTDAYGVINVYMSASDILTFGDLTENNTFDPDDTPITVYVWSTTDDNSAGLIFIDGYGVYAWKSDVVEPVSLQFFSMNNWERVMDYDYRCGKRAVDILQDVS